MRPIRKGEWRELKKWERDPWRESMESDVRTHCHHNQAQNQEINKKKIYK